MRIVSKSPLVEFYDRNPDAREGFEKWYETALQADWSNFAEVRAAFPQADLVKEQARFIPRVQRAWQSLSDRLRRTL